ncbi:MAG TPA: selenoneine biosynthesis selenosugar synthase SenB [Burkholderiaceae bacterium]|nr:selenoneine biosynthesis selenosugar synthase SenB [Burkholderiaceae bacterium]
MHKPSIVLVTPALAGANNGNWQTARRWAQMLRQAYRVRLTDRWDAGDEALMIALHARRSAASVAAWSAAWPRRPLLLVLTGTDLYRDLQADASARASAARADRLVVLNDFGARSLPPELQGRTRVILQSCAARRPLPKTTRHLRALMVGHLREEKDPLTYLRAAQLLAHRDDILLDHVGAALDPALGEAAADTAARCPRYRWLGGRPHAEVRRRIQAAHVLVHPSRLEGGAHVVIEAVRSGTPVLASAIDGNLGLLGADYPAVFAPGDAAALAGWLERLRDDADMLCALRGRVTASASRFAPQAEAAALLGLVAETLNLPAGDRS